MIVKREHKTSGIFKLLVFLFLFYYTLRVCTYMLQNGGQFQLEYLDFVLSKIWVVWTPVIINADTLFPAFFIGFFGFAVVETLSTQYKKNLQDNTHGSAEWEDPKKTLSLREKELEKNMIFTKTEQTSKDMSVSKLSRNVMLLGRPGTGKSRYYFKPNILNANNETLVITDPKGELLECCAKSLVDKGYSVKCFNLVDKWKSDHYNPLLYIKKISKEAMYFDLNRDSSKTWQEEMNGIDAQDVGQEKIAEDDVMTLINSIMLNTKSETIESNTGDPFWEKAEMVFLQAIFYYVIFNYEDHEKNFTTIMNLIRMGEPDDKGNSELKMLFDKWEEKDPHNIGIKQWKHFVVSAKSPKMMSTIIMTASARLAPFNINEIEELVRNDELELERMGEAGEKGKFAIFIVTDPMNKTFNFLANILYTQIFTTIDTNARKHNFWLTTPVTLYMDEWAQLGVIPNFLEMLAYVRGLNCGVTIGIQSLDQLKKNYEKNWETALDCCDYFLFMGSRSKTTLEYVSTMLGKKTWYKKSSGRTYSRQGSSSQNWDVVGRELAFIDELGEMKNGKCILLIAGLKPFFSDLYDINTHPMYSELYEPRADRKDGSTRENFYNHPVFKRAFKEGYKKQQMMNVLGLKCAKVGKEFKPKDLTKYQVKQLEKGVMLSTNSMTDNLLK